MRWIWLLAVAGMGAAVEPPGIVLAGPGAGQQLVVSGGACSLVSSNVAVAVVEGRRVVGKAPGVAEVRCGGVPVRVEVRDQTTQHLEPRFSPDVVSILTIKGCNGSGCHGSPAGQNGFKLSLFGYDVEADHAMVLKRANLTDPEKSPLLRKPLFDAPHGGGRLMTRESEEYKTLLAWLRQGAKIDSRGARLVRLEMYPREAVLTGGALQPIAVIGRLSDGTTRDMTGEVRFSSGDESVAKIAGGVVRAEARGITTVLACMGQVAAMRVGVTAGGRSVGTFAVNNFVDELVGARLRVMNVAAAPLTADSEFLRRVFLDAIGRPPLTEE